jgi:RNA polymerase sigma-70 factor, ECF subfamily
MSRSPTDLHAVDLFEAERAHLLGVAYRITGSRAEADDIVQDAWLRWQSADQVAIERPGAWLTTVTSRLALDRLRSAQHRREQYVGPWLPEMATTEPGPDVRAELIESLTLGFLAVLERLGPVERVVFLLADVFKVPYDEIATVVDRSPEACRQVASRARRRVRAERPRFKPTDDDAWRVAGAFLEAALAGDIDAVLAVLSPEVVEVSDGGAHHRAGRRPVVGADRVARLVVNIARKNIGPHLEVEPRLVNGQPGVVLVERGHVRLALACSVVDGLVDRVWVLVNPAKTATSEHPPIR